MNRSYRAPEKEMLIKKQNGSLRNIGLRREKEQELGLFSDLKKREKELRHHHHHYSDSSSNGSRDGQMYSMRKTGADEFLNSQKNDKNDYEWLLTPPGRPLFPSLEMQSHKTVMNQNGTTKAHPSTLKSRLSSTQPEANGRSNLLSRPQAASPGPSAGQHRPSSGGSGSGLGSRPSTPTNSRPALGTQSRAVSNPVSKSRPTSTTTAKPARSSTPTRSTLSSSKPTVPARSSTPVSRSTARSSTPTSSRPSLSTAKPAPRAPTPPRRPPTLSSVTKTSAPIVRSPSTVTNSASSPNARPRPWKPQEMPGYTLDAPPNLRTSLNDRPISNMRGRAGAPSSRSSSIEPLPNGRVRRQSCSPSRGRLPTGVNRKSGTSVPIPALNRAYAKANDTVNPGSYGTKMVERVINMRKLMPPRQDDKHSPQSNLSGKSSSPDSSGFGRSISKKSLDMAMRHMDLRRTVPGNLRPLLSKIPASSMYSVRSGPTRSRINSVSDSPLATSSNASSEMSVNNIHHQLDENIDECNSEKGGFPC